ncbi:hypothetical protein SLS57_008801 [Botryosphaeria dothidea]
MGEEFIDGMQGKNNATMTSAAKIKTFSKEILIGLCNTCNFTSPLFQKHVCPTFAAIHSDNPPSATWDDFLAKWQKTLTFMPDFHIDIVGAVAEVDEDTQKGKVWVFSKMNGLPGGKTQDSVDMMDWARGICVRSKDVQQIIES